MAKKKVLIIDDDAELGEEMAEALEAEGYAAHTASDGRKALAIIRANSYDAFLLDFKIQDMTGADLLREIRKKDPAAPVFFISGRPDLAAALEAEGVAGAAAGIIEKPFNSGTLIDKLKKFL